MGVFLTPLDCHDLLKRAHMGGKSCLQVHFESRGEKTTTWMMLVAEILVLAEK